jgi:hypothetical protein
VEYKIRGGGGPGKMAMPASLAGLRRLRQGYALHTTKESQLPCKDTLLLTVIVGGMLTQKGPPLTQGDGPLCRWPLTISRYP